MPNHVHLLERTGLSFWQDESYDHRIRNCKEFGRIIAYIQENPVSAGLVDWPWRAESGR